MNFCFRILLLLILSPLILKAQEVTNKCHKSTEGTDFWFGFMESRNYHSGHYLEITVTARETTDFKISIGPNETLNGTYTVLGNNSRQVVIPWSQVEAIGSESIQDKGIHLVSEKPVNVYALNWDANSADVAVIYPIESLGTEYFAICYEPHISESSGGSYGNGRNSEFLIVAFQDSTVVEITPSVVTDSLKKADSLFTVTLNKGQIYQVQSMNRNNRPGQGDLTGSYIKTSKPVAFYSGSLATTIPATSGVSAWDHLYEQIPPLHSWGREFFTVPLKTRQQDRYRIMASQDNTTINISGLSPITLNRGEFTEFVLFYYEPKRILSDKPILIAQYSQSQSVDKSYTGNNGDPFMIILSPISQSKNDVTFVAYDSDQIKNYSVNIISLTSEIPNLVMVGYNILNSFNPFSGTDYSYAQITVTPGTQRIYNKNPDKGFLAYVYGFGGVESYGYGVGFNLDLVLDLGQSINFNGDTLLLCYGDTRTLDAGSYFDTYDWNTGDTTQTLKVVDGGKYSVTTTTNEGCVLFDSIYIFMSKPEIKLDINKDEGCFPYSININAKDGFNKYIWLDQNNDTISTSQKITASNTGEYRITVYDKYDCPARDTMKLTVFEVPLVDLSCDKLICGDSTNIIEVSILGTPDSLWNYPGSFKWSSNKPESLTFSFEKHKSVQVNITSWGEYEIYYGLTTIDGCQVFDTITTSFYPTPTSDFRFEEDSPDEKCKGYSREVLYIGSATELGIFYWNFEGSKIVDSLGWQNFRVSFGANMAPSIHLVVEENGCLSDTTTAFLGANPDFKLETLASRGCDTMTVNFRGILAVEDALKFEWDFGNGNTSDLQSPSHFYPDTGFYDVGLTITNVLTDCQVAFTINDFVKVFPTPVADFSADPSFCYPDSLQAIYLNNIDSSFCFWEFQGAHELGKNNDSIWVNIDSSMAKITLQVDEYGCLSNPASKMVKRKPHFDFYTEDEEGCQPYLLEAIAIPYDDLLDFTWMHDTLPNNNSDFDYYLFKKPGRFDVGLIAYSGETQCVDTLIKTNWIWVHPKPVATFNVDYPVATIENPTIRFTNLSGPGLTYSWDFDDGNYSTFEHPQHTYTDLGEYNSSLIAETEFGCLDTTEFLIKILPFSVFTPNAFRPDSEIHENRYFMPVGIGANPEHFNIKIFDRWGQVVFESDNPENKWDGKIKTGENAPMGNYVWVAVYEDIQGFEHKQNGQVILLR